MNKIFLTFVLGMFLFSFASAGTVPGSPFKLDEEMQITNHCSAGGCTFMKISSIKYPNGTTIYLGAAMTQNDQTFNYTFVPDQIGTYSVYYLDDPQGVIELSDSDEFIVTPEGNDIGESGTLLVGVLMALLFLVIFFLFLGLKQEDKTYKLFFILLTIIAFFFAIGITNTLIRGYSTSEGLVDLFDYMYWTYLVVGGIAAIFVFIDLLIKVFAPK